MNSHVSVVISGENLKVADLHAVHPGSGESHSHQTGQVFRLLAGLAVIESDKGRIIIAPHQTGWIPPGVSHSAEEHGKLAGWAVYLAPALCENLPGYACALHCSEFIPLIAERILAWRNAAVPSGRQENLLRVLLDELHAATPVLQLLPFPGDERLRRLARSLAQNPADGRDLAAWAKAVGMSTRNCSRRFREETGMTFARWRRFARIYKSRELLAGGMPVQEAAWTTGYESVSSYIAAFKDIFGVTPGEAAPAPA